MNNNILQEISFAAPQTRSNYAFWAAPLPLVVFLCIHKLIKVQHPETTANGAPDCHAEANKACFRQEVKDAGAI